MFVVIDEVEQHRPQYSRVDEALWSFAANRRTASAICSASPITRFDARIGSDVPGKVLHQSAFDRKTGPRKPHTADERRLDSASILSTS